MELHHPQPVRPTPETDTKARAPDPFAAPTTSSHCSECEHEMIKRFVRIEQHACRASERCAPFRNSAPCWTPWREMGLTAHEYWEIKERLRAIENRLRRAREASDDVELAGLSISAPKY